MNLIDTRKKGKRNLFVARDPKAIVSTLQTKKEAVENILPDLRDLFKKEKNKPSTKYYYGLDEIKNIFEEYSGAEELLFIVASDKVFTTYPAFFEKFRKKMVKEGIFIRDILTHSADESIAKKTKETMKGFYDYKFLSRDQDALPTSIRIWCNHVALITLDEPALGMVITNESMAATFKIMFNTMWKVLPSPAGAPARGDTEYV